MKKFAVLSLVFIIMAMLSVSAFAEGELTVTQDSLFIFDNDDDGYFCAKVENTGDEPVYYRSGELNLYDEDNNAFVTEKYVSTSPSSFYLEPGDFAYIKESIYDKKLLETPVNRYDFAVTTDKWGSKYTPIPCEADFNFSGDSSGSQVFITFTNNTEDLMHDLYFTAALFDANDTLVSVVSTDYAYIALHPGASATVMLNMNSWVVKHLAAHDLAPVRVEGYVYTK